MGRSIGGDKVSPGGSRTGFGVGRDSSICNFALDKPQLPPPQRPRGNLSFDVAFRPTRPPEPVTIVLTTNNFN